MTVKQIVDDEKRIIQDRFKEDIDRIQQANVSQIRGLEQHSVAVKNKNEKLYRVLIEKEASLLEAQSQNVKGNSELKQVTQQKEILEAKLRALESYTTDL